MQTRRKIAVAGATGRVGRHVVDVLEARGHDVVPMARATGVDVISGDGLADALEGVESIVDAASWPTPDQEAATAFFIASTRNLQGAGERAGVEKIVVVSIIGAERSSQRPRGSGAGNSRARAGYVSDRYELLRHGGGGAPTTLICGAVRLDHPAARSVVEMLPPVIHLEASGSLQLEWMQSTLRLMAAEARELRPGGEAVVTRLADILVVQAIRFWLESDPAAQSGWLGALQDKQIGRAIALIHKDPARPWTVAALARALAMSRSAFAARFTELVGEPVMHYVARWRMQLALDSLRDGATVGELAGRLGYRSEAAFARAFKRVMGIPPGAVRRRPGPGVEVSA